MYLASTVFAITTLASVCCQTDNANQNANKSRLATLSCRLSTLTQFDFMLAEHESQAFTCECPMKIEGCSEKHGFQQSSS